MTSELTNRGARINFGWAAFVSGFGLTDEYNITMSQGSPTSLVNHVRDVCKRFHPQNEVNEFPVDFPAFLFWRAPTDGLYIAMRVRRDDRALTGRSPRIALEYYGIVLTADDLGRLDNDPFKVEEYGLFDDVAATFRGGNKQTLFVNLPDQRPQGLPSGAADTQWTGDQVATSETIDAFRRWVADTARRGIPPSFATWWPHGKPVPDMFATVLSSVPHQQLRLSDMVSLIQQLSIDIGYVLLVVSSDDTKVQTQITAIDNAVKELSTAVLTGVKDVNKLSPPQFRNAMDTAAVKALQVGTSITTLLKFVGPSLITVRAGEIADLAKRCTDLSQELSKLDHPNPLMTHSAVAEPRQPSMSGADSVTAFHLWLQLMLACVATVVLISVIPDMVKHRPGPLAIGLPSHQPAKLATDNRRPDVTKELHDRIRYTLPQDMQVGVPVEFHVAITKSEMIRLQSALLPSRLSQEDPLPNLDTAIVELHGSPSYFQIQAIDASENKVAIPTDDIATWDWEITPLQAGKDGILKLVVKTPEEDPQGQPIIRAHVVFERTFTVGVNYKYSFQHLPWLTIGTTLLSMLVGNGVVMEVIKRRAAQKQKPKKRTNKDEREDEAKASDGEAGNKQPAKGQATLKSQPDAEAAGSD